MSLYFSDSKLCLDLYEHLKTKINNISPLKLIKSSLQPHSEDEIMVKSCLK